MTETGNWFPGHMAKALRQLKSDVGKIHGVVEVLDARAPQATRNPELEQLFPDLPHLLALCKADLADNSKLNKAIDQFKNEGLTAIPVTSKKGLKGLKPLFDACLKQCTVSKKLDGFVYTQKVLIVGIPNVGKSSIINAIRGGQAAKTGNKPGVTKHLKWIDVSKNLAFCDSPGILWPKITTDDQRYQLAALNCIKEERIPRHKLSEFILEFLQKNYPNELQKRYQLKEATAPIPQILDEIGHERGFLSQGESLDEQRLYTHIITDFQGGAFGRVSF